MSKKPPRNTSYMELIFELDIWLIFWNLLGVLINKVLIKSFKFLPHSIYFLEIFQNRPKMFDISNLLGSSYK